MEQKIGPIKEKNQKYPGFDDYEVEDAARTIKRAEEIKQDKKLYDFALSCLKKEANAINSISDLKKVREDKYGAESGY